MVYLIATKKHGNLKSVMQLQLPNLITHSIMGFVCLLVLCCFVVSMPSVHGVGERAEMECKSYGENMIECQRILRRAMRRIPADLLQFPHMVIIGYSKSKNWPHEKLNWSCGGSLISPSWVLTAAHCVNDSRVGPARRMKVGATTFEYEEVADLVQERDVDQLIIHPGYKPPSKYHDVALISAAKPFELTRHVRIACLPSSDDEIFKSAIATGFGKIQFDDAEGSHTLMQVELDLVDSKTCNETMKSLIVKGQISEGIVDSQLCAGDLDKGGKDTCQGDSGGPLQVMAENVDCIHTFPLFKILGVTSFGRFCGFKNSPGVYSRVSSYLPWIEDIVWPKNT